MCNFFTWNLNTHTKKDVRSFYYLLFLFYFSFHLFCVNTDFYCDDEHDDDHEDHTPFCLWKEVLEMLSGHHKNDVKRNKWKEEEGRFFIVYCMKMWLNWMSSCIVILSFNNGLCGVKNWILFGDFSHLKSMCHCGKFTRKKRVWMVFEWWNDWWWMMK